MSNDAKEAASEVIGCIVIFVLYAALGALAAWVVEWAWNIFVSGVFHGPRIDYWQAWALYILASMAAGLLKPTPIQSKS